MFLEAGSSLCDAKRETRWSRSMLFDSQLMHNRRRTRRVRICVGKPGLHHAMRSAFGCGLDVGGGHGQAHDETRVARLGFDVNSSAEFLRDDAVHDLEAETGARSLRLSSEKRFEDVRQNVRCDARAVIADAHHKRAGLGPRGDFDFRAFGRGIRGIVDEISPYLAEGVAASFDGGGRGR